MASFLPNEEELVWCARPAEYNDSTTLLAARKSTSTDVGVNISGKTSALGNQLTTGLYQLPPLKPRFQFTNGSQFVWKNYFNGWSAIASAAALSIDEGIALWWKWLWLLLMVVAGVVFQLRECK
jgi:hypothetical protein